MEDFGEPATGRPRKSEVRQRTASVSVRLNAWELAEVQRRAGVRGQTLAAYLRECGLSEELYPVPVEIGTLVLRGLAYTRGLTAEEVSEAFRWVDIHTVPHEEMGG